MMLPAPPLYCGDVIICGRALKGPARGRLTPHEILTTQTKSVCLLTMQEPERVRKTMHLPMIVGAVQH